jgi:hypothetical protein
MISYLEQNRKRWYSLSTRFAGETIPAFETIYSD